MTRLLFPICAALLSTLAGLHLSTHLRQEEQRLARWGEVLPHLHLLMASCAYSLPEAFRLCADGHHPPDALLRQLADELERTPLSSPGALTDKLWSPPGSEKDIISRMMHLLSRGSLESRLLAVENARQEVVLMHEKAARKADKDARLYQTLGWIGGLCLLLILM